MIRHGARVPKRIRNATRFALAVVVVGCSRGAVVRSPAATSSSVATSPLSTVITLERKPCFGTCPVYLVSITGDGAVVFDGRANVDSARRVTSHLDADRVASLIKLFDDSQYFTLDDRYVYGEQNCKTYAADAPLVITSITTKDRVKRVEHDAGCFNVPARLADLERKIDEMVGTSRWIGRR